MEEKKFFGLRKNVFVVGLVSLFMDISSEMVYPLVPLFLTGVLGTTMITVGVIEGIAESTASILKVFSGWIADRFGRRKLLMLIGYSTSTLSRGVLGAAGSWGDVLGARFIDRVGKGVRTAPRDAIIADSAGDKTLGRAFGFHRAMDSVGAIIGPALAALLLAVFAGNMRLVFLLSIIPGAIAVFLIAAFVREKARRAGSGEKARPSDPCDPPDNGELRRYIIVIALFSLGNTSDAFLILRAGSLGIPAGMIPVVYLSLNAVYAASSVPLGVFADRVGLKNMVLGGFFFYSA
ncbi:MAG: MFS transporter, partial [Deltaproteobacteria bacterium]|nr:MFS transporter [Deltaproteobacteria bacterium]